MRRRGKIASRVLALVPVLLIGWSAAWGQGVEIGLRTGLEDGGARVGDLIDVAVEVNARSAAITSVSFFLSFDASVFELVPAEVGADGVRRPFRSGPFLPAQVYRNEVEADGSGRVFLAYTAVAGSGTGGERPAASGSGVVAVFRVRLIGAPPGGETARIGVDDAGERSSFYTELERPGVKGRFRFPPVDARIRVIGGEEDVEESGVREERERPAPPDTGVEVAFPPVEVSEAPLIVGPGRLELRADEVLRLSLDEFAEDPDTADELLEWEVMTVGEVEAALEDGRWMRVWSTTDGGDGGRLVLTVRDPQQNVSVQQILVVVVHAEEGKDGVAPLLEEGFDRGEVPEIEIDDAAIEGGEDATIGEDEGEAAVDPVATVEEIVDVPQMGESGGLAEPVDDVNPVEREEGFAPVNGPEGEAAEEVDLPAEEPVVPESQVEPDEGMRLGDIPDVRIGQGEELRIELGNYLAEGADGEVKWTVSGSGELEVELEGDGSALLSAPTGYSGQVVLIFTAHDGLGGSQSDLVRVDIFADGAAERKIEEASVEAVHEEQVLSLGGPPDVRLAAGTVDSSLTLDGLIVGGDAERVIWSVRGGVRVMGRIGEGRRLVLDARGAVPGREVVFLEAVLGEERASVPIGVNIRSPVLEILPLPGLSLMAGETDSSLVLDRFVEGDFAPEQIAWQVIEPAGTARIDPLTRKMMVTGRETYELVLLAVGPAGSSAGATVMVRVSAGAVEEVPVEMEEVVVEDAGEIAEEVGGVRTPEPVIVEGAVPDEVSTVDELPPRLRLEGGVLSRGWVELRVWSDEELANLPEVEVGGERLTVIARGDRYIARYPLGREGRVQVVVTGVDRAGNVGGERIVLAGGAVGRSGDGMLTVRSRLAAGQGFVLVHAEEEGYRVDFEGKDGVDLLFRGELVEMGGLGVWRWDADGDVWVEVPSLFDPETGGVYAPVTLPGRYKIDATEEVVERLEGSLAYPNPFNARVAIRYLVPAKGRVHLRIYDIRGRLVRSLIDQVQAAGPWTAVWDGRGEAERPVASGVYIYVVEAEGTRRLGRVTLVR